MKSKFLSIKKISLRTKIYIFVYLILLFVLVLPESSAFNIDDFGFGVADLYVNITKNVDETNEILHSAFEFTKITPFEIVNSLTGANADSLIAMRTAILSLAFVVATLLLMVNFFKKVTRFEFASKWENILILLVQIIVVKQVVQNADIIMGYVYSGFDTVNKAVFSDGNEMSFLPAGEKYTYTIQKEEGVDWVWNRTIGHFTGEKFYNSVAKYEISHDAVEIFYPNAFDRGIPARAGENSASFRAPTDAANFSATMDIVLLQPYFLAFKAIALLIFVVAIGRVFELSIYTIFAPLSLATFACDSTSDTGKNFIKTYIACVLQIAVIISMFYIFRACQDYMAKNFGNTILLQFVVLATFGLGVIKSGTWAKKVCGTS